MKNDDFIGSAAAAQLLGCTQDHIGLLARRKAIPSRRIGRFLLLRRADVLAYRPGLRGGSRHRGRKKS